MPRRGQLRADAKSRRRLWLRVMTADPELLLAMKVRAARTGDRADIIILLADRMGLSTAAAVLSVAERVFEEPVPPRQRQVIEDLFLR